MSKLSVQSVLYAPQSIAASLKAGKGSQLTTLGPPAALNIAATGVALNGVLGIQLTEWTGFGLSALLQAGLGMLQSPGGTPVASATGSGYALSNGAPVIYPSTAPAPDHAESGSPYQRPQWQATNYAGFEAEGLAGDTWVNLQQFDKAMESNPALKENDAYYHATIVPELERYNGVQAGGYGYAHSLSTFFSKEQVNPMSGEDFATLISRVMQQTGGSDRDPATGALIPTGDPAVDKLTGLGGAPLVS